jgi:hypothetical protein
VGYPGFFIGGNMRKILFVALLILTLSVPVFAGVMTTVTTHGAVSVVASGSSSSTAIDLQRRRIDGFFSIQVNVTGSGTVKIEYLLSNDGVTYIEPATASDIVSGFTATSGPGSDGNGFYSFAPEPARYMKIKVTETGTSQTAITTVTLMMN